MADEVPSAARTYQFGDTDLAAERLRRLAEVFEPSSREFLVRLPLENPREIADLGCGPGYTTRLLADVFPTAQISGVDSSAHFIELAQRVSTDRVRYLVADVSDSVPGGPYDLIYCRYLLTHVATPAAAIHRWGQRLRPGGLLAIEENDWILCDQPAFARYLEIVTAMLADAGQRLYVGADLEVIDAWTPLEKRSSEVVPIAVGDRAAAAMFLPNLATWRQQPFVRRNCLADELDRLRDDLERLYNLDSPQRSITFGRRRLVLARPSG